MKRRGGTRWKEADVFHASLIARSKAPWQGYRSSLEFAPLSQCTAALNNWIVVKFLSTLSSSVVNQVCQR